MTRRKGKGTPLEVTSGKAAKTNLAIFNSLGKQSPQTLKQLQKQVSKHKGLEETYFSSLTKRVNYLQKTGYLKQAKPTQQQKDAKTKTSAPEYVLTAKAPLAMFLNSYSMQEIIAQATETQAALILLSLLNVVLSEVD